MMKKIAFLMMFAILPLCAGDFGQVGTAGAQFLKINFDPRASALGYAAASVVSGASAVYTNVAGIENIKSLDVSFGYTPWFADIKMMSFTGAYRLQDIGVIGIQASGFSTQEEVTTIEMENGTGEMYSIKNLCFGVSFARHITDRLIVGVQGKLINESYYEHSTTGFAGDLGTMYDLGFSESCLALSLQNFGPDLSPLSGSYRDYSESDSLKSFNGAPLPVTFRASFSIVPIATEAYSIRLIADLVHPNDNTEHYNIGTEIKMLGFLAIRGGLKLNYDDESFALGMGFDGSKLVGNNVHLDYSFEKFKILPSIQKISIGFAM
jgi:hypothetical protein